MLCHVIDRDVQQSNGCTLHTAFKSGRENLVGSKKLRCFCSANYHVTQSQNKRISTLKQSVKRNTIFIITRLARFIGRHGISAHTVQYEFGKSFV